MVEMSDEDDLHREGRPLRVLCLGGGSICEAVMNHLASTNASFVVLDTDPRCRVAGRCQVHEGLWEGPPALVIGDAIEGAMRLMEEHEVDLIVPAVPGHAMGMLTMAWGKGRLSPRGSMTVLDGLNRVLAGSGRAAMDEGNGTIIATLNTTALPCPLDCPQEGPCPITGQPRKVDMGVVLEDVIARMGIAGVVIRPVRVGHFGAVTAEQARALRGLVEKLRAGEVVAVATSCSCHAIMNVFKVV